MNEYMNERNETGCLAVGCTELVVPGTAVCRTHRSSEGRKVPRGVCMVNECPGKPRGLEYFCSAHHEFQKAADRVLEALVDAGLMRPSGTTPDGDTIYESLVFDKSIDEKRRALEILGLDLETLNPKGSIGFGFDMRPLLP